jgi:hypothetical protein
LNNVVRLITAKTERQSTLDEAWQRWLDLNAKAKESQDINDGLAAGRAYREFMDLSARADK